MQRPGELGTDRQTHTHTHTHFSLLKSGHLFLTFSFPWWNCKRTHRFCSSLYYDWYPSTWKEYMGGMWNQTPEWAGVLFLSSRHLALGPRSGAINYRPSSCCSERKNPACPPSPWCVPCCPLISFKLPMGPEVSGCFRGWEGWLDPANSPFHTWNISSCQNTQEISKWWGTHLKRLQGLHLGQLEIKMINNKNGS